MLLIIEVLGYLLPQYKTNKEPKFLLEYNNFSKNYILSLFRVKKIHSDSSIFLHKVPVAYVPSCNEHVTQPKAKQSKLVKDFDNPSLLKIEHVKKMPYLVEHVKKLHKTFYKKKIWINYVIFLNCTWKFLCLATPPWQILQQSNKQQWITLQHIDKCTQILKV